MKIQLTFILVLQIALSFAQLEGTYSAFQPKRCVVTLTLNPDSSCYCLMDFPKYGAFEAYDGVWSLYRNKISIWIVDSSNNKTKVSSYKLVDQDDDIVLKGTKPFGRIRIFRKKKFYLKKS